MVVAWAFTLPSAAVVGAVAATLATRGWFGVLVIATAAVGAAGAIVALSRRQPVHSGDVTEHRPAVPRPATTHTPHAALHRI
jgi:PiT family inorganic phosphate transporter